LRFMKPEAARVRGQSEVSEQSRHFAFQIFDESLVVETKYPAGQRGVHMLDQARIVPIVSAEIHQVGRKAGFTVEVGRETGEAAGKGIASYVDDFRVWQSQMD